MKDRWDGLNYIEIGSGPGRCIIRNDCTEMDGTLSRYRSKHFSSLKRAIFVDASSRVTGIVNQRLSALNLETAAMAVVATM